jgi:DNA repair protein RadC
MEIAEEEIKTAKTWHPRRHKQLDAAFAALVPTEPLRGLADDLYRVHCRELLDRATGKGDMRRGTAAEVVGALAVASLEAPPSPAATLLYERLFTSLFPDKARSVLGSERVRKADEYEKTAMRELEATLRRKLATDRGLKPDRVREREVSYGGVPPGLAPAISSRVIPIREVLIRYRGPRLGASERIGAPENAVRFAERVIKDDAREHFLAIHLDARHRPVGHQVVSVGTATATLVHPREVFQPAVLLGALGTILLHNHPSGDPTPSREDRALTRRLCEAGRVLGIPVLDHVVWARSQGFVSLREQGDVPTPSYDDD